MPGHKVCPGSVITLPLHFSGALGVWEIWRNAWHWALLSRVGPRKLGGFRLWILILMPLFCVVSSNRFHQNLDVTKAKMYVARTSTNCIQQVLTVCRVETFWCWCLGKRLHFHKQEGLSSLKASLRSSQTLDQSNIYTFRRKNCKHAQFFILLYKDLKKKKRLNIYSDHYVIKKRL